MGFFNRLKKSLTKTREAVTGRVEAMVYGRSTVDEELYDELEEILIQADVGVATALELVDHVRAVLKEKRWDDPTKLRPILREKMGAILAGEDRTTLNLTHKPAVIMVVGVNGTGKTTTTGKLAHLLKQEGKKVLLAAGDTFRAAAIDQIEVWGQRAGVEVIKQSEGSDPAAVVYDAARAAVARDVDVVVVDTAGRLHTKVNLMEELKKIYRVLGREIPGAPHEVLLVLDATTGQNAVSQAKLFGDATGVTGLVLTKLDGTAKGGIVLAIKRELEIPVKLVGTGEQISDLAYFRTGDFVRAIFDD